MLRCFALLLAVWLPMAAQTSQLQTLPHSVNTIWHGNGAPANSLGTDGDFYLDASAYNIYGPRANGVWPAGFSLLVVAGPGSGLPGPVGPAGAAATIAAGTATALAAGATPTVNNSGTSSAAVFNFGIPAGPTGPQGPAGPPGAVTSVGTSSTSYADAEVPGGSVNGTNATFTLAHAPSPAASLELVKNGQILQAGGFDYTLSGATLTFVSGTIPATGDLLQAWYRYTGSSASFNYSDAEVPSGTINGTNSAFTLNHTPAGSSLQLTRNGLIQKLGIDYTISGATITFLTVAIPGTGETLQAWYRY
jgi:hypothetical protein